jgi:rRNA-processing protein FCF1
MNTPDKKVTDPELIFSLEATFPDAEGVFFGGFASLNASAADAIIVLDTNVLLMPYSLGNHSLSEIRKIYENLTSTNRLFVPERVAREFATNRSAKVADIYASIENKKSGKTKHRFMYPLINDLDEMKAVDQALKKLNESEAEYFRSIDSLLERIRSWDWADPISAMYSSLFDSSVLCAHKLTNEELQTEHARRFKLKLPPGYKDSSKDDGGVGDFAIWLSLLELGKSEQKHLIFVSEETKADWWQRSNGSEFLLRYELVDEYRRVSNGKSLHLVKLSKLLQLFKASKTAVQETKLVESMNNVKPDHVLRHISAMNAREHARFSKLSRSDQRAEMLAWFYGNYADPVEMCPYESAEGGYQYIWGGPYNARVALESEFGGIASETLIIEVAEELDDICWEWSGRPDDEPNDP